MADETTSGDIRARRFDVVRKGYDRSQVQEFLASLADRIDELEAAAARSSDETGLDVGLDDPEALARELNVIGDEVGSILEAARSTAEGLRRRASEDARTWTESAEASSTAMRNEAVEQSQAMRSAAWEQGTSMLESAKVEAERLLAAAREEALFIRAEAEREAIRLTGDAKRDREEIIRTARSEAEQIVTQARGESDGMLAAAKQAADHAQERAKALEERRAELLAELEAARASIGELETEIESKRQQLDTPEPAEPATDGRTHHTDDGGSVRIVSGNKVVPLKPVDADSFVAEVEQLQRADGDDAVVVDLEAVTVVAPVSPEVPGAPDEPTPIRPETPDVPDVEAPQTVQPPEEAVQQLPEEAVQQLPERVAAEIEVADELDSLFASLKEPVDVPGGQPEEPEEQDEPAEPHGDEPVDATPSRLDPPTGDTAVSNEDDGSSSGDATDASDADTPMSASLITARNSALRAIKRTLVDLQNDTLEHLRTEPGWLPDEGFTDRFDEPFTELATTLAGAGDDVGAAAVFAADLYDAVRSAIEQASDAGAGDRAIAAAASKVFRTWRSDEAERRVVAASEALPSNAG